MAISTIWVSPNLKEKKNEKTKTVPFAVSVLLFHVSVFFGIAAQSLLAIKL